MMTPGAAEIAGRLPSGRWRAVLEYARWMRDHRSPLAGSHAPGAAPGASVRGDAVVSAASAGRVLQIKRVMRGLACMQRGRLDEYVLALAADRQYRRMDLRQFVGCIAKEDLPLMREAIDEHDAVSVPGPEGPDPAPALLDGTQHGLPLATRIPTRSLAHVAC